MSKPTEYEVTNAMKLYGGSFIEQLTRLYDCADNTNRQRIREAFSDYWTEYEELAEMMKKKSAHVPAE